MPESIEEFYRTINERGGTLPDIIIDLDGVFADFIRGVEDMTGKKFDASDEDAFDKLKQEIFKNNFFLNLKPMKDYMTLWNFVKKHNPKILTATGEHHTSIVAKEKSLWVRRFLGADVPFYHVVKSHDKAKFAKPNNLLIDDRKKSIEPFKKAGGQVILHKNAASTVRKLKAMGYD